MLKKNGLKDLKCKQSFNVFNSILSLESLTFFAFQNEPRFEFRSTIALNFK